MTALVHLHRAKHPLRAVGLGRHVHLVNACSVRVMAGWVLMWGCVLWLVLTIHGLCSLGLDAALPKCLLLCRQLSLLLFHLGLLLCELTLFIQTPLLHLLNSNSLFHCAHVQPLFLLLAFNQLHLLLELNFLKHLLLATHFLRSANLLPFNLLKLRPSGTNLFELFTKRNKIALVVLERVDARNELGMHQRQ